MRARPADDRSVSDRIVIVGYDDQPHASDALALGAMLARSANGRLLITHAHRVGETAAFGRLLHEASRHVPYGVRVETRAVAHDTAATGLATLADDENAEVVVVGSSHRGRLGRALLGSVGEQLLRQSPCALAVAPLNFAEHASAVIETIGVAFDGDAESLQALDRALTIAGAVGARLRLMAVAEQPERREVLRAALEQAAASLPPDVAADTELLSGSPAPALSERCQEGVDLLVTGSHGYGPVRRALLGSVSTQLMRSCPCPLYVVPRGAAEPPASAAA